MHGRLTAARYAPLFRAGYAQRKVVEKSYFGKLLPS
jgi:hypothetical protein